MGFLGATLLWLSRHRPELIDQTRQVILPKDYLRLKMTGQIATDVSDAAGTGIFDIRRREWAAEILRRAGLPGHILPPVLSSTAVAGPLTVAAATELGLPAGIPVVAGCADQPAQAIGNGLIEPGLASVTTGSGGQVFTPSARCGRPIPACTSSTTPRRICGTCWGRFCPPGCRCAGCAT